MVCGGFKYFLVSPRSLGKMNPFWLIFLKRVETTNQIKACLSLQLSFLDDTPLLDTPLPKPNWVIYMFPFFLTWRKQKIWQLSFWPKPWIFAVFFLMTSCPVIQGFHIVWVGSIRAPVMPHFSFKKIFKVRTDASFVWHDAATSRERQT